MALDLYRKKRDFKVTPEPKGKQAKPKGRGLAFVIQKHAASRLHYDFRLELNGVLLSWAVPKGPSLDPNDKRLAMHVEDHPIEYGSFEGIIPAKQYGAGTVLLWDRGTWLPMEDPVAGYRKGKLKFELHGEKLHGGWTLVKSYGGKYGDNAWLLFKEDDPYARTGSAARVVDDQPDSVATHRSLKQIAADPGRVWHSNKPVSENVKNSADRKTRARIDLVKIAGARKAALPDFMHAQLAKPTDTAPSSDRWVHEVKHDGYRMLCRVEAGGVHIYSRNHREWTEEFPHVARALAELPIESGWIDGEIVCLDSQGRSSFQALQNALSTKTTDAAFYYVFDLLYLNGYDLREVGLEQRKALLKRLVPDASLIRYSDHFNVTGSKFFAEIRKLGLEGMISKLRTSKYTASRSEAWLKIKCGQQQEFVVGGFTDSAGSRQGFGALLIGVYDHVGDLRYSGKVGTGFNHAQLLQIRKALDPLMQDKSPFVNPPGGSEGRRAHWVKPELVVQVAFTQWTSDAILRNSSFLGLRHDKKARDVVREEPSLAASRPSEMPDLSSSPPSKIETFAEKAHDIVAGIKLTNPDKVLYPEAGITKRDLAIYYEAIGAWILPHLRNRPLTLLRCPDGWNKECFYQKHADQSVAKIIDRVAINDSSGQATYMMANSVGALVALTQMGALELHPWGSRTPKLDLPDRIVFDFDPDESLEWKKITEAVNLLKTLLDTLGLRGFLKTTGGKGLHVVVPITPTLPWEPLKGFSQAIAELLVKTFPDRFTSKLLKISRHGKIFIDYLRNGEGSTAVAAYSARAKANAPVSTPIEWAEIARDVRYDHFNIKNVPARLKRLKRDPWNEFAALRQTVTKSMMKKVGYTS